MSDAKYTKVMTEPEFESVKDAIFLCEEDEAGFCGICGNLTHHHASTCELGKASAVIDAVSRRDSSAVLVPAETVERVKGALHAAIHDRPTAHSDAVWAMLNEAYRLITQTQSQGKE